MQTTLFIIFTQVLFFYIDASLFRLILILLQLILYRKSIKELINCKRWYSLIFLIFSFSITLYSIVIGIFQADIIFNRNIPGWNLYNPNLFTPERIKTAQSILNFSMNLFFIIYLYLLNQKLKFPMFKKYILEKSKNQYSYFIKYVNNFSNLFLFNTLLGITVCFSIITTIGPTILTSQYPIIDYQILDYYYALPIILFTTFINFLFLKRDLFYLFVISSFGLFVCLSSFVLYFGVRGFVVCLLIFYSINLFIYFYNKGIRILLSLKGFIYSLFLLISIYLEICLVFFLPAVRGTLYITPIRNNIFSFWNYIYDLPFLSNEFSYNYFQLAKERFNIFFYDNHFSLNEGLYQLLIVIELLERGLNNGFKSFANLPLQALPSIFDGVLYERPLSDSQILAELNLEGIRSAGGFLLQANLFWNNYWLGLIIGIVLLSFLVFWIDNSIIDGKMIHQIIYYISLPIFFAQLLYGLQGIMRIIEIVLLSSVIFRIDFQKNKKI
tara:strand:+ start:32500 stop:33990 length:1491 start_codon:yes stop_codon:yes gene_type:complete